MSAYQRSGYLTRLLQRSRGMVQGGIAPRRKALFEDNPGAAAVSESPRMAHGPGEHAPDSPWEAPQAETESGRLTQTRNRDRQVPAAVTDNAPSRQAPVYEPVAQKVAQDPVIAQQPPRRERGRIPPTPPSEGATPVFAKPRDANLDTAMPPIELRPVEVGNPAESSEIARQTPQATDTRYPEGRVTSEASPGPEPLNVPVKVRRKDADEGPAPEPRRPVQIGEQRIASGYTLEQPEPTPEIKPVSQAATEPTSVTADPVGERRGGTRGWLETPRALPPEPTQSRNSPQASPTVKITIGRIEVRAVSSQRRPPAPARTVSRPRQPAMSLDDYLKKRNGGGR